MKTIPFYRNRKLCLQKASIVLVRFKAGFLSNATKTAVTQALYNYKLNIRQMKTFN